MSLEYTEWINRAVSSLKIAQSMDSDEIYYEDLCFHARQAVEKALKAVLVKHGIIPPRSHNLVFLLKEVSHICLIPENLEAVIDLNDYSVMTRYPGDYEPVNQEEYERAVCLAETAITWAKERLI